MSTTRRSTLASLVNLLFVTHVGFFGDYTAKLADGTDIGRGVGHNRGSHRGLHGDSDWRKSGIEVIELLPVVVEDSNCDLLLKTTR